MKKRTRRSNGRKNTLPKPIVTAIRSLTTIAAGNQNVTKFYTSNMLVGEDYKVRSWHPVRYRLRFNPLGELPDDAMVIISAVDSASGIPVPISAAVPLNQTTNTYISVTVPSGTCRGWHNSEDTTNNVLAITYINNNSSQAFNASVVIEVHGMMAIDGFVPLVIPS